MNINFFSVKLNLNILLKTGAKHTKHQNLLCWICSSTCFLWTKDTLLEGSVTIIHVFSYPTTSYESTYSHEKIKSLLFLLQLYDLPFD